MVHSNFCVRCGRVLITAFLLIAASAPSGTLRESADRAGILIGAAVRPSVFKEAAYSQTLSHEFNMIEPENDLKWSAVRRRQDAFDFSGGDAVVAFARAHNMKVRGHCLVWDHDHPAWLAQSHFAPELLSQLLKDHITTEMKHYAGQVFAWDVLNEAVDEKGQLRDSIWYNRPGIGLSNRGTAYIEQAFRWARAADPGTLLFYNEAEAEGLGGKSDAIYAMLKDFKQRGVPIDGVGLQMHIAQLDFDPAPVQANIARLTALGLQVHITELDVSLPVRSDGTASSEDLQRQAEIYRGIVRACLQNIGCTAIQTWGFTDKYSWIGSQSHGTRGGALLFDRSYRPKPAYDAILQEIFFKASNHR
jgi:endo-1,4-beta-xylanase